MAAFSKLQGVITPKNTALCAVATAVAWGFIRKRIEKNKARIGEPEVKYKIADEKTKPKDKKEDRAAVDKVFFRRLSRILSILVPGWFCAEMWYILIIAASLTARTYCDVWMIQNGTLIESAIIGRSSELFKTYLFRFIYAMPVISIVNNTLKYGLNELKLRFRTRLTYHLYERYLRGFTYYKMSNLDNRISNPDQLLTTDVEKFCNSVADLYSNLSKPILDIGIYSVKLAGAIGVMGPTYMLGYLALSGLFLTRLRRPMGKMTVAEQKLEGEFRYVNSRLITNSEEIAFYQGNIKEKNVLLAAFQNVVNHLRGLIYFRFNMGLIDNMVAKYCATVVGYMVVSRPFLNIADTRLRGKSHSEMLEDYYNSGRMLVRMAEAIGRVILAGREMTRLSGFTQRITEFMDVLDDLNQGRYVRTMVTNAPDDSEHKKTTLKPGSGRIVKQDNIIKFENVPLVTPNGDILVDELNFEVRSGTNVLICGPNGCGKSSLFRMLGELWPLFGGTVTKPESKELFYVPQRPYLSLGTLRDQVIYPNNKQNVRRKGMTDRDLQNILEKVQLSYILDREGGWDAVQDWMDTLSGGEKQRIAMARLFYHKPQFAILDECTSAVSVDVEGMMYQHCREVGITLFTVSHRKSLWKHHEFYLHMDGRGSFEFKPITAETTEFGS